MTDERPTMIKDLITQGETLTIEFKSDGGPLDDAELLNTVVCLANAQGGQLLIGVEDDGEITGLHTAHRTRPELLTFYNAECGTTISIDQFGQWMDALSRIRVDMIDDGESGDAFLIHE